MLWNQCRCKSSLTADKVNTTWARSTQFFDAIIQPSYERHYASNEQETY